MIASIKTYCDKLVGSFNEIPNDRKQLLDKLSHYIEEKKRSDKSISLIYVCTHNSRRSHFGQIWAKVAAHYFNVMNINTFSGGTEATAFNINAINALRRIGFNIQPVSIEKNPVYLVIFDEKEPMIRCYSKTFDDSNNPKKDFAAIMTCSDAEENCPFIPGVELRLGTTYDDPKAFDGTPLQEMKYDERCRQIALETLYVFSKVK